MSKGKNRMMHCGLGMGLLVWSAWALASGSVTGNFQAQITIQDTCAITTTPTNLNFGTQGVLVSNVDTSSTVKVTCTTGASYNIGLDAGSYESVSNDVNTRRMSDGASHYVSYNIYTDAPGGSVWTNTVGAGTLSSSGTGVEQSFTVHGRVQPQTTPVAAAYADTVVVTVSY